MTPEEYHILKKLYPFIEKNSLNLEDNCKEIGIPHKSSHKARKTFISTLIDSAVNINTVRQMAGYSDERTTYNSYVFDRHPESEKNQMIEEALNNMK